MRSYEDGTDLKADRHYEHWLDRVGKLAKDAIEDALKTWTVSDVFDALDVVLPFRTIRDYDHDEDSPATAVVYKIGAAVLLLRGLAPEDAIHVCDRMNLPGEWEYTSDWDGRTDL